MTVMSHATSNESVRSLPALVVGGFRRVDDLWRTLCAVGGPRRCAWLLTTWGLLYGIPLIVVIRQLQGATPRTLSTLALCVISGLFALASDIAASETYPLLLRAGLRQARWVMLGIGLGPWALVALSHGAAGTPFAYGWLLAVGGVLLWRLLSMSTLFATPHATAATQPARPQSTPVATTVTDRTTATATATADQPAVAEHEAERLNVTTRPAARRETLPMSEEILLVDEDDQVADETDSLEEPTPLEEDEEDIEAPAPAHWSQRGTNEAGADQLTGSTLAEFATGQKQAIVHIPFQPPFAQVPAMHCDLDESLAPGLRAKVAAVYVYGARIELRRSGEILPALQVPVFYRVQQFMRTDNG